MATNRTFIEISPLLTEADAKRLAQELANGKPKLSAADREILKRLSETLNIWEEGVRGFFRIVRQAQIVSHRIVPKLAEIAFGQRRLSAGGQIGFCELTCLPGFRKRTHGEAPQSQHRIQTSDRAGVHCRRDAAWPGEAA
jgi:hypothetical protein